MSELPDHVDPMLAKIGKPFDSDDHLFEVKWDGTRAISLIDGGGYRVHNRRRRDMKMRYPELLGIDGGERGVVFDGELVVLGDDGKPAFRGMLTREQARTPQRAAALARTHPANYVVFDLLYRGYTPLLERPLRERRAQLAEVVEALKHPRVVLSEGVEGRGLAFFEEIQRMEMEGMIAKELTSPYRPGTRTDAWQKIKPIKHMHCVVIGYQLREGELRSLIVAAPLDGVLTCLGRVGSGLTRDACERLLPALVARHRDDPLIACDVPGQYVEPGVYCQVSYLELSRTGLRAPVFQSYAIE